jgi:hypothetical protein
MTPDLFVQAEADFRTQRFLREAEEYRLARQVPSRASRSKVHGGQTRGVVINARTTGWTGAMWARRIRWALRSLT